MSHNKLNQLVTPAQQMVMLQQEQAFVNPFEQGGEEMYAAGGSIPERYKNMGFNKVGVKKKSSRPGKKWMVLAKKGDKYKVVHGGDSKMKDFTQHGSEKRKDRFWDRMGGRDSAKAKDPFSPLYWHKKFGTWQEGGQPCFECGGSYMEDGGWIQEATERMKAKGTVGAFTKQAKRAGYDSVQSFANHVLNNTDDYTSTTVKRAQFAKNMGKISHAAYGMQLPKHQGFGPSQVGSGMFNVWQQDQQMQNIYDQMQAEQQAAQQTDPQQQPAFVPGMGTIDWMNWDPNDTSFGNMKLQYETVEERLNQPYGVYQKNIEALGLPSMDMSNSGVREERNLSWMAPAANVALGVAGAYARGVENRRRQDEFATRTAADNVFAMAPQGLPGDRGDYDANTGFFRPDEMGFKNDARYWNPYVAQASIYRAEQGGQFGTVDEQLLQELIAAGADIEIID